MTSNKSLGRPIISVLMAIYNEPQVWMQESIESILNQTFTDFEFIIINDNPERDLNKKLLVEYIKRDNRIVIVNNEENIGLTRSLNKGLEIAKGDFVARMDGDDISLPSRFEKQIYFMSNHPDVIVCGTQIEYFGLTKKRFTDWIHENHEKIIPQLILSTCIAHPTVMIRKTILDVNNIKYDPIFKQAQDLKLWIDLKDKGKFHNIPMVLLRYRISHKQISEKSKGSQNEYARNLRRELIKDFYYSLSGKKIDIPNELTINFIKEIKNKENLLYLNFPEKKTKFSYYIFTNILIAVYLSINTNKIKVLTYFLASNDIKRISSNFNNILRIFEKIIYSKKKQSRI